MGLSREVISFFY